VRYLVVSDLHYGLPQLDWVAEQAPSFDAVVFAGDHLDVVGTVDLAAQIALLTAYFARLCDATTVIANSGNHDLSRRGDHGEKYADWIGELDPRVVADGSTRSFDDDLVTVCAWWEGPATLARLEAELRAAADRRDGHARWIWVYHAPPDASPTSRSGARHFGDEVLNRLIADHRPDVVLTGHVHESPFQPDGSWFDRIDGSVVLNAGRQRGPIPAHLVLDTGTGRAEWWSSAGAATIAL
jgi:Icc-related predicted phosphoesterase